MYVRLTQQEKGFSAAGFGANAMMQPFEAITTIDL